MNFGVGQTDARRFIEVIGYAEVEIIPNEIIFTVELADKKMGKEFIQLSSIERNLFEIINELNIDSSRISIVDTHNRRFNYKRKKDEIVRSKEYEIHFSTIGEVDEFAERLEAVEIERGGITRIGHSDFLLIEEGLKVEAIRNAKDRALKLAEAIGEKMGGLIEASELYESGFREYMLNVYSNFNTYASIASRGELSPSYGTKPDVDFRKVKLSTTIRTKFEIVK